MASFAAPPPSPPAPSTFSAELEAWLVAQAEAACIATAHNSRSPTTNVDGKPWRIVQQKADLKLEIFQSEAVGTPLLRHKAVCVVDGITPNDLLTFILNNEHRLTWDRNIANLTVVPVADLSFDRDGRHFQRRCYILRSATKKVGPITGRDFVDTNMILEFDDGSIASGGVGLQQDQIGTYFPVTPTFVRGINYPSGWFFERCGVDGRDCKVSYIIHCDLKGWFTPLVINNAIGGSFVSFFADLKSALRAAGMGSSTLAM